MSRPTGHDFPAAPVKREDFREPVYVCRTCGVARLKVKGVFHYWNDYEHMGTGISCLWVLREAELRGVKVR